MLLVHHGHWKRRMGEKSEVRVDPGYFDDPCPGSDQPAKRIPTNPIDPWEPDIPTGTEQT